MHRRAGHQTWSVAVFGRAATGALSSLRPILLLIGVFLFTLAVAATAVSGTAHRTVFLEYNQADAGH